VHAGLTARACATPPGVIARSVGPRARSVTLDANHEPNTPVKQLLWVFSVVSPSLRSSSWRQDRHPGLKAAAKAGTVQTLPRRVLRQPAKDPQLGENVVDVVGQYMAPPKGALVLCVDEKTQIQALDRTQATLPMKAGEAARMTHDCNRNGTTSLYAVLEITTGEVTGVCTGP
jgi:hypothetical protein